MPAGICRIKSKGGGAMTTPRSPATDPKRGDVLFVRGMKLAVTWREGELVGFKKHNTNHVYRVDDWRELCAGAMVLENADLKGAKP